MGHFFCKNSVRKPKVFYILPLVDNTMINIVFRASKIFGAELVHFALQNRKISILRSISSK